MFYLIITAIAFLIGIYIYYFQKAKAKEVEKETKEKAQKIIDWFHRNFLWFVPLVIIGYYTMHKYSMGDLAMMILGAECFALGLSGAALYIYTRIKFLQSSTYPVEPTTSILARYIVITGIFLSVHLLVSVITIGFYLAQFNHIEKALNQ